MSYLLDVRKGAISVTERFGNMLLTWACEVFCRPHEGRGYGGPVRDPMAPKLSEAQNPRAAQRPSSMMR